VSRTITARYPGVCQECEGRFLPGEAITSAEYGRGYQHAECPEVAVEKPTRFVGSTDEEMGF
jgi:hypothetical protein